MKMTAKIVPYSSVVGSSVTVHADNNFTVCQLSLLNVIPPQFEFTPAKHREASERIAKWVADALNAAPPFEPLPLARQTPQGGQRMIDEKGPEAAHTAASRYLCNGLYVLPKANIESIITAYLSASAEPVATNPDVMFGRETVTRLAKQLGVEDSPTTVFKAALAMARETRDGALVLPPLDPEDPDV